MHVVLVVRGLEADDAAQPRLRAFLAEATALPFIVSVMPSWLDAFEKWQACVGAQGGASDASESASAVAASNRTSAEAGALELSLAAKEEGPRPLDLQALATFLLDDAQHSCAGEAELKAAAARKAAQRLLEPCFDDDDEFLLISNGRVCADAVSQCSPGEQYAQTVRKLCPRLCGVCTPKPVAAVAPPADEQAAAAAGGGKGAHRGGGRGAKEAGNSSSADVAVAAPAAAGAEPAPAELAAPRTRAVPASASGGKEFSQDVIRDDMRGHDRARASGPARVLAHRFVLVSRMKENMRVDWEEQYPLLEGMLRRHGIDGFVNHYRYEFGACDHSIPRLLLTNLAMAATSICVVCALFLKLRTAVLCALAVLCIDGILIGAMAAYGVPLHAVTGITLLVSLGAQPHLPLSSLLFPAPPLRGAPIAPATASRPAAPRCALTRARLPSPLAPPSPPFPPSPMPARRPGDRLLVAPLPRLRARAARDGAREGRLRPLDDGPVDLERRLVDAARRRVHGLLCHAHLPDSFPHPLAHGAHGAPLRARARRLVPPICACLLRVLRVLLGCAPPAWLPPPAAGADEPVAPLAAPRPACRSSSACSWRSS